MSGSTVVAEFTAAMERFAPFENSPHLAVAVSGGADSMALCLLAHDWAVARGGRVTALTVDHGLRPASAKEAAQVGSWISACGIEHHILRWQGEKPASAVQNSARVARYRLLCEWCRQANVLHLLLGHHADDQSETVLHRLVRGSGIFGLAGMSALVETSEVRLLRPLLSCRPAALRSLLTERGQDWLEDPSNRDPRFARTHVRSVQPSLATVGLTRSVLLAAAAQMAATRSVVQEAVVRSLGPKLPHSSDGFCADRARGNGDGADPRRRQGSCPPGDGDRRVGERVPGGRVTTRLRAVVTRGQCRDDVGALSLAHPRAASLHLSRTAQSSSALHASLRLRTPMGRPLPAEGVRSGRDCHAVLALRETGG